MIRHIVCFRLKESDAATRRSHAEIVKSSLEALVGVVPTIGSLEVGIGIGPTPPHWDAVLVSEFASEDDLAAYQTHPEHVRAAGSIDEYVADRAIVDYRV